MQDLLSMTDQPAEAAAPVNMQGRLATHDAAIVFALAGNATLTLVSEKTGTRYTYKVRKGKDLDAPYFVSVMFGPDNVGDFAYLGTIFPGKGYNHGRKSKIGYDDPRNKAWAWFWSHMKACKMPDGIEVWHEGKCGKCGRKLTVPASIERGIGPECAKLKGGAL